MPYAPSEPPEIDLDFLTTCLKEAGKLVLGRRGRFQAAIKEDHTPVTEFDRQVEDFLVPRILERYPNHAILSEETGLQNQAGRDDAAAGGYRWVIDPIDGTRSFASGLPIWGVSIGVLYDNQPLAGGLYLPVTGEIYFGTCRQAFYNDQPLAPIRVPDFNSVLNFLAVPSDFHLEFETDFPRIRSMGSTAAHLAYVLTGAAAGMMTSKASLWDIAGLLPALQAVGAEMRYLDGDPFRRRGANLRSKTQPPGSCGPPCFHADASGAPPQKARLTKPDGLASINGNRSRPGRAPPGFPPACPLARCERD